MKAERKGGRARDGRPARVSVRLETYAGDGMGSPTASRRQSRADRVRRLPSPPSEGRSGDRMQLGQVGPEVSLKQTDVASEGQSRTVSDPHFPERECHRTTDRSTPAEAKSGRRGAKARPRTGRRREERNVFFRNGCKGDCDFDLAFPKESTAADVRYGHPRIVGYRRSQFVVHDRKKEFRQ
jgi:hypothetical protein